MKLLPFTFAIFYFFFPRDLIPDYLGLLGRIDDILIFALLWWRYKNVVNAARPKSNQQDSKRSEKNNSFSKNATNSSADPYEVLGLERGATQDQVDSSYRTLASKYHPDKVQHLGEALQKLAHEKMIEIQRAYEALKVTSHSK